jgi:hypothetical protein
VISHLLAIDPHSFDAYGVCVKPCCSSRQIEYAVLVATVDGLRVKQKKVCKETFAYLAPVF